MFSVLKKKAAGPQARGTVRRGREVVYRSNYEPPKVVSFPAMGVKTSPVTRAGNVGEL